MVLGDTLRTFSSAFSGGSVLALVIAPDGALLYSSRGASWPQTIATPSPSEMERAAVRVARTRKPDSLEVASGAVVFQLALRPLVDGDDVVAVIGVGVDVTERKASEERLRRNEALLVDTQGVAHLGTWEWDISQPTAIWSEELYRIYAETPASYTPTYEGYLKKVHPDDREHVERATAAAFREMKPYSHDERIFRPDGSTRYLHTWGHAVTDADGKLVKLIGVCQDITDRKMAEDALVEAQKFEAVGRLASGVAHDFNNLLAVVIGNVGILQSKLTPSDLLQRHLEEISTVCRQGARLTQQLLSVSRGEECGREALDLGRVVSDLDPFLSSAVGESVRLSVRTPDVPAIVLANRSQIEQVVLNLVVNARDAMPEGGHLSVVVTDTRSSGLKVPAEIDVHTDCAVLEVTDSGVGIDAALLPRLFEPYFTTKSQGHGLGLATVYAIAQQAGGTVTVTTGLGLGTTFRIFVPLADQKPVEAPAGRPEDAARAMSLRILFVEDQDLVRRALGTLLENLGCTVLEAAGPREALAIAENREHRIDLLMTDVVMPVMSGVELARRVRELRPEIKTLFVSGWSDRQVFPREGEEGTPVLRKPFTTAELTAAILGAVGREPTTTSKEDAQSNLAHGTAQRR